MGENTKRKLIIVKNERMVKGIWVLLDTSEYLEIHVNPDDIEIRE